MVLATGLRLQEFTYLLACEIPLLPPHPTRMPIPFPVPARIAKGSKFRLTWISYEALTRVHAYLALERMLAVEGSRWQPPHRWGRPLVVTEMDARGGRVNGRRVSWDALRPGQRRRLVAPDGGTMLLAARSDGGPSPPGPACSSGPRSGSPSVLSRVSRTSTRTGSGTFSLLYACVVISRCLAGGGRGWGCPGPCCVSTVSAHDLELLLVSGLGVLGR
jgi:hypothetical protein